MESRRHRMTLNLLLRRPAGRTLVILGLKATGWNLVEESEALNEFVCLLREADLFDLLQLLFFVSAGDCWCCGSLALNILFLNRSDAFHTDLGKFSVKVGLVLNVANFVDELELHFVIDVELLVALADLHLEVVVCLLDLCDVHLLQLNGVYKFCLTLVICWNQLRTASF